MRRFSIADCSSSVSPGRLIRRIDKTMTVWIDDRLAAHGLSYSQWVALKLVADGYASNPGMLARDLGYSTGAVTRLIDGLEQRGLMARDRAAGDRRVVSLVLTDEGAAQLNALAPEVLDPWNDVLEEFNDDEGELLVGLLNRLLKAAERKAAGALNEAVGA